MLLIFFFKEYLVSTDFIPLTPGSSPLKLSGVRQSEILSVASLGLFRGEWVNNYSFKIQRKIGIVFLVTGAL